MAAIPNNFRKKDFKTERIDAHYTRPDTLIKRIQEAVERIPESCQESITFDVDYERGYYDDISAFLQISWIAAESDEDMQKRWDEFQAQEKEKAKQLTLKKEEQDRAEYERLKKKFEGS